MNIIIAPDKFRGSLDSAEVIRAISEGVAEVCPQADIHAFPLADGGEGTMEILTELAGDGVYIQKEVSDPLGRPVLAQYGYSRSSQMAFIEMAAASGLALLPPEAHNPMLTNTYGTGELILDAIENGASTILLGIGGSATTDAGIGMAAALGFRFFDEAGEAVPPIGGNMERISQIDAQRVDPRVAKVAFIIACDVGNPLYGPNGAAAVYGPQKGASDEMVLKLDRGLERINQVATTFFGTNVGLVPGAGAAGGLGAGCLWFLNGKLQEGVSLVMQQSGLPTLMAQADLVITGEGKVDVQTLEGKVVQGLANLCRENRVPMAVICGSLQLTSAQLDAAGITYAASIINRPMNLDAALEEAYDLVKHATIQMMRLFSFSR
ncbi:glycerate kinase [Dyadobacter jejuensis]|uniref:Glycerate kinase n=1 Tax=Dyadobacter jejuensis TaxID=1082580 RepID=A0A316AL53_9BACT|nr:glycerate kinase [Dyadobacter jejuensis]PWJ58232.1 glycerate kinase [Dyadobacter jejuensis]